SAPCFCQFIRTCRLVLFFLPSAMTSLSATQWKRTIAAGPTTRICGSLYSSNRNFDFPLVALATNVGRASLRASGWLLLTAPPRTALRAPWRRGRSAPCGMRRGFSPPPPHPPKRPRPERCREARRQAPAKARHDERCPLSPPFTVLLRLFRLHATT